MRNIKDFLHLNLVALLPLLNSLRGTAQILQIKPPSALWLLVNVVSLRRGSFFDIFF